MLGDALFAKTILDVTAIATDRFPSIGNVRPAPRKTFRVMNVRLAKHAPIANTGATCAMQPRDRAVMLGGTGTVRIRPVDRLWWALRPAWCFIGRNSRSAGPLRICVDRTESRVT